MRPIIFSFGLGLLVLGLWPPIMWGTVAVGAGIALGGWLARPNKKQVEKK